VRLQCEWGREGSVGSSSSSSSSSRQQQQEAAAAQITASHATHAITHRLD
jgi:hypothetical protein